MENTSNFSKIFKVIFLITLAGGIIYAGIISFSFFKQNSKFNNHRELSFKIIQSNLKKSKGTEVEKQLELEDLQDNTIDTISIENLIPDKTLRTDIINKTPVNEPVKIIVVEDSEGEILLENTSYISYTETEYSNVKNEQKNKYIRSLGITSMILFTTFSGNLVATRIAKKNSKKKKRKKNKV